MSKVLIKKSEGGGPQVATQSAGGIGLVMPAPSWNKFDSQKYEDAGYSPKAVAAARRWHTIGNIGRGAATGLGALNAVYNQTASGEPGEDSEETCLRKKKRRKREVVWQTLTIQGAYQVTTHTIRLLIYMSLSILNC